MRFSRAIQFHPRTNGLIVVAALVALFLAFPAWAQILDWVEPDCTPPNVRVGGVCTSPETYAPLLGANLKQSKGGSLRIGTTNTTPPFNYTVEVQGDADVSGALTASTTALTSAFTADATTLVVDTSNGRVVLAGFPSPTAKLSVQGGSSDGIDITSTGQRALVITNSLGQALAGSTAGVGQAGVSGLYTGAAAGNGAYGEGNGTGVKGEIIGAIAPALKRGVVGSAGVPGTGVDGWTSSTGALGTTAGVWGKGSQYGIKALATGQGPPPPICVSSSSNSSCSVSVAKPSLAAGGPRYSVYVGAPPVSGATDAYAGYFDGILRSASVIQALRFLPTAPGPSLLPFTSGQFLNVDSVLASDVTGLAFDGTYLWVANGGTDVLSKVRASDGVKVGQVDLDPASATNRPVALAFDGQYVFVTSNDGANPAKLFRIRVLDDVVQGPLAFPAGAVLTDLAVGSSYFNAVTNVAGVYDWVLGSQAGTPRVWRIAPDFVEAPPGALTSYVLAANAGRVIFDGTFLWVANGVSNSVSRVCTTTAAPCAAIGNRTEYAVGANAVDVATDGAYVWVANRTDGTVSKLRSTDGSVVGTYATGAAPAGQRLPVRLAVDGTFLWLANLNVDPTVSSFSKIRLADGTLVNEFPISSGNWTGGKAMLFDGMNLWLGAASAPMVSRLYAGTGKGQTAPGDGVTLYENFTPSAGQNGGINVSGVGTIGGNLNVTGDLVVSANASTSSTTVPTPPAALTAVSPTADCPVGQYIKGTITNNGVLTNIICGTL